MNKLTLFASSLACPLATEQDLAIVRSCEINSNDNEADDILSEILTIAFPVCVSAENMEVVNGLRFYRPSEEINKHRPIIQLDDNSAMTLNS